MAIASDERSSDRGHKDPAFKPPGSVALEVTMMHVRIIVPSHQKGVTRIERIPHETERKQTTIGWIVLLIELVPVNARGWFAIEKIPHDTDGCQDHQRRKTRIGVDRERRRDRHRHGKHPPNAPRDGPQRAKDVFRFHHQDPLSPAPDHLSRRSPSITTS
ncbi:hypothetical protein [Thiocapsa roseopersicina]|uniref:hypothetical protein n=1 Tax=Thiocapsa roseopersicina TaxID=1058 RepID=UPI00111394B8|nr:hypothetical protein [Thiocapsa roseopersicina]